MEQHEGNVNIADYAGQLNKLANEQYIRTLSEDRGNDQLNGG